VSACQSAGGGRGKSLRKLDRPQLHLERDRADGGIHCAPSATGTGANGGCFSTSFITTTGWDSLNWGAPNVYGTGSGQSGLGNATGSSIGITNSSGPDVQSVHGLDMQVQRAPIGSGSSTSISRVDNLYYEWNGSGWFSPGGHGLPALAYFPGHFNSNAPASPPVQAPPPGAPAGDHVLRLPSNGSSLDIVMLNNTAYGVWFQIGSLSCAAHDGYAANVNCLFDVTVQAFDSLNQSIGSYTLAESGTYGSGGQCTGLITQTPGPVPCNDAPYAGFYDPEGRIQSIYISVFNHGGSSQVGFSIDTLLVDPVPEPAMPLTIGGGLAAIALYRRKRRVRVG